MRDMPTDIALGIMEPAALRLLLEFLGVTTAFALLWHLVVRNFVVASILSGICVAITLGLMTNDFYPLSVFSVSWTFATYCLPAVIISLGIGIPFNRRRNPLPPADEPEESRSVSYWNQRVTWQHVVPLLVVMLIFLIREIWDR